jgi:hypothetical protein
MNVSKRIARLEKLGGVDCGKISMAVLDGRLSEQEFHRLTALFE